MERTLDKLHVKLKNSITKHGVWNTYSQIDMKKAITDELVEVIEAIENDDYTGDHGVSSELLDVAVTCVKAAYQIELRYRK